MEVYIEQGGKRAKFYWVTAGLISTIAPKADSVIVWQEWHTIVYL